MARAHYRIDLIVNESKVREQCRDYVYANALINVVM